MKPKKPSSLNLKECKWIQEVLFENTCVCFFQWRLKDEKRELVLTICEPKNARKLAKWLIKWAEWKESRE